MSETKRSNSYTWKSLLTLLVATLGAGSLVGFLTQQDSHFYDELTQPPFAPPGWLFPVAWAILYASMAIAMWLVLREQPRERFLLLGLYITQLAVNLTWPFIFFTLQALGLGFFWLVLLWLLAGIMLWQFFRQSVAAGLLLIPYQLWLTFAAVLNFCLARLNP